MLSRPLPELVACFEATTLPHDEWTHEAHLAVALTFFRESSDNEGTTLERMRAAIKHYNAATGVVDGPMSGYHETLTAFWVSAVAAFARDYESSMQIVFPRLLERWGESRAPLNYYSKRLLMSPMARGRFFPPDKAPFDW